MRHRSAFVLPRLLLAAPLVAGLGCFAYANQKADRDEHPITNHGVGATIVYPGQGPAMPATPRPGGGSYPGGSGSTQGSGVPGAQGAPSSQGGASQGAPGGAPQGSHPQGRAAPPQGGPGGGAPGQTVHPGGSHLTFIGGAERDEEEQIELRAEPPWWKYLALPFAVVAYPFKAVGDALTGEDGPPEAAASPHAQGPTPPPAPVDPDAAHEQARLEALERELASRRGDDPGTAPPERRDAASPPAPSPAPSPSSSDPPQRSAASAPQSFGGEMSIADELAALRGGGDARPAGAGTGGASSSPLPAEPTAPPPSRTAEGSPDRVEDRDGDGRPDHWVYREDGRPVRELTDEDGDGQPDRVVHLDPESGEPVRMEEDANLDGEADTFVEYRRGEVVRQRRDADHDGFLDTWAFYRAGQLVREERDLDGDGYRDRIALYRGDRLAEEREDRDGDGRVDRITRYDGEERIARRDEDRDGDGLVDVRSFYEAGKLVRRELVENPSQPIEEDELASSSWSAGEEGAEAGSDEAVRR